MINSINGCLSKNDAVKYGCIPSTTLAAKHEMLLNFSLPAGFCSINGCLSKNDAMEYGCIPSTTLAAKHEMLLNFSLPAGFCVLPQQPIMISSHHQRLNFHNNQS